MYRSYMPRRHTFHEFYWPYFPYPRWFRSLMSSFDSATASNRLQRNFILFQLALQKQLRFPQHIQPHNQHTQPSLFELLNGVKSNMEMVAIIDVIVAFIRFIQQVVMITEKRTKFIIHQQQPQKQLNPRSTNIFFNHRKNSTALENFSLHSIVGDPTFKQKFYNERSTNAMTVDTSQGLDQSWNSTFCQFTRNRQNKTLATKLSVDKQLQITHDERTLGRTRFYQQRDKKIEKYIKMRSNKSKFAETVTFGSVQQIYVHPNPQKDQLINDNIPEYWKNSLRDNEKRLKRHMKGHSFKREVAEEMLQTLKGRKMLESSMPPVKEEFKSIPCSRTIIKEMRSNRKKGFSLQGRRISQVQGDSQENSMQKLKFCNFDEVHKIHYDSKRRWMACQL